ncbi:MAG: sigma-70 family RNA polymerase sigma factor [Deltaproteobacteria bacterium]|nr:sigma-70 family RNA polymerase sigma factor [Deltaproteobacteria bacterium]
MNITSESALLIQALLSNDRSAWECFVKRYSPVVWSSINRTFDRYCPHSGEMEREDVYSKVFIALLENDFAVLRSYDHARSSSMATYLAVISTRKAIDHLRSEKQFRYVSVVCEDGTSLLDSIPDAKADLHHLIEKAEDANSVKSAVSLLTERDRKMYHLMFDKELSAEQIAGALSVSIPAIYIRKTRLVEKLKKIMKDISPACV